MDLVLASNNAKKLAELEALLRPLGVNLIAQGSLGVPEAPEPHATFLENALAKARHAAELTGRAAIADDSGLAVDALGGAPGVLSARYATLFGGERSDAANNQTLLEQLDRLGPQAVRQARFISVLVALRSAQDPEPLVAVGRWQGELLHAPRGEGGFGYDPLLYIPDLGCTVAELGPRMKNTHSHRALAMREMLALMGTAWQLGQA